MYYLLQQCFVLEKHIVHKIHITDYSVPRSNSTAGASIPATGAAFMRPVSGGMVTSPFGYRTSGFHKGVDILAQLHMLEL